jgi:pimeloyl-ACP methyl ester carboxylesterase
MMVSAMRLPILSLSFLSALIALSAAPALAQAPASGAPAATAPASAFHPTRFSVATGGSGPDVILIPGLASSRDVYKDEIARLIPHYHLYVVQIYGFAGYKSGPNATGPLLQPITDELAQYIEANHLQQPAVIGHSMGGLLGLMLASQHPADVGKLMVVDALPFYFLLGDAKATVEFHKPEAIQARTEMLNESADTFLHSENVLVRGLVSSPENQKLILFWLANSDRKVLATAAYEDMVTDVRLDLPKITAPVTVLYAGGDKDTEKLYTAAYAGTPHLKLIPVEGSQHFIMLDQPKKFDDAVQAFLKN